MEKKLKKNENVNERISIEILDAYLYLRRLVKFKFLRLQDKHRLMDLIQENSQAIR